MYASPHTVVNKHAFSVFHSKWLLSSSELH